jgi:uncharacterized protein (DUF488 family)
MTLYTIGYEGLDVDAFVSLLAERRIETVVDVRQLPLSRKRGFSKRGLMATLCSSGVEYVHMVELGCPRDVRDRYRHDGDWKLYTEGFLHHLSGRGDAVAELSELSRSSRCALLCYEADFSHCHRSMVAEAVQRRTSLKIEHISATRIKRPVAHQPVFVSADR